MKTTKIQAGYYKGTREDGNTFTVGLDREARLWILELTRPSGKRFVHYCEYSSLKAASKAAEEVDALFWSKWWSDGRDMTNKYEDS